MPRDQVCNTPANHEHILVPQPVQDPDPFLPGPDDLGSLEHLEVTRDRRLPDAEERLDIATAPLSVRQQLHDPQAGRVSERLQELGFALVAGGLGSRFRGLFHASMRILT